MIVLFDTPQSRSGLYPLSLMRPVCDTRYGILTTREFWQILSGQAVLALTENYLQQEPEAAPFYICVDASVVPNKLCADKILALQPGEMLEDEHGLIAYAVIAFPAYNQLPVWIEKSVQSTRQLRLKHAADIFQTNAKKIAADFKLLTTGKITAPIDGSNTLINAENVFVAENVEMKACIINATEGPVFIGENALIMEGTMIRGPVAICNNAVVKMGSKLYAGTTIGPYCTAGGEIKNSVLTAYSNKAHDGYLGDSVIGEWCNLGAGTTNSNVKNTGGEVKMWSETQQQFIPAGQKAGVIMGDYSRTAINSSINTGTVIGVSCNVYEGTYPQKHLPSFSWGNYELYDFEKACADAANWKKMKGSEFTPADRLILRHIFEGVQPMDDRP